MGIDGKDKPPCKGCSDRDILCHSSCDKYIEWQNRHLEKVRNKIAIKTKENSVRSYTIQAIKNMRKGRHKDG